MAKLTVNWQRRIRALTTEGKLCVVVVGTVFGDWYIV